MAERQVGKQGTEARWMGAGGTCQVKDRRSTATLTFSDGGQQTGSAVRREGHLWEGSSSMSHAPSKRL